MKLLGRYPKKVASQYKELLLNNDIEVKLEGSANNNPFGNLDSTYDSLLIAQESYEKAAGIIKDYEIKNEIQVKKDSKKSDKIVVYVFMAVVAVIMVMFYMFRGK